jgi:hypothetical protein
MAHVFREDTGKFLGFLTDLRGPFSPGTKHWPFRAWRHSNGKLRGVPEGPAAVAGRLRAPPYVTVHIPVSNIDSTDVHLLVPSDLVEFILTHDGFRAAPQPA